MSRTLSNRWTLIGSGLLVLFGLLATPAGAAETPEPEELGSYTEALIAKARDDVKKNPDDVKVMALLGKYLARKYDIMETDELRTEGLAVLEKAAKKDPANPEVQAFTGLLKCLGGRVHEDKKAARAGLDMIDNALKAAPDNLTIRYLDASVCIEVPKNWNRMDGGGQEMEKVAQMIEKDRSLSAKWDVSLCNAHYKIGKYYREKKDYTTAVTHWKRAAGLAPYSRFGKQSRKLIERYDTGTVKRPDWTPAGNR